MKAITYQTVGVRDPRTPLADSKNADLHRRWAYVDATVSALAPLAMTAYFWVIWRMYLDPPTDANGLIFGRPGANAIYYSWFVIATLGLSISQYGLESVEASMLRRPRWAPKNDFQMREHRDHTWARPDGWLRLIRRMILYKRRRPSMLWTLLAVITLFGYVGLPLSGLAMNFGTGYFTSTSHPQVSGFNETSWNSRFKMSIRQRTSLDWSTGATSPMPRAGVIYSGPDTDRSSLPYLTSLPNFLPNNSGTPILFLGPQADAPVDGRSWGLVFGYNCSVVTRLSDFTILSHRQPSANFTTIHSTYTVLGGNATIEVYNETNSDVTATFADNIQAVAEIGYDDPGQSQNEAAAPPAASDCYNPIPLPQGQEMPYPGLDQPQVLELALWQNLSARNLAVTDPPTVNLSLPNTIPELFGVYNTSVDPQVGAPAPMAAIGVRCSSVSAVGTADLYGRQSTFTGFQRSDTTAAGGSGLQCAERLSLGVPRLLFSNALANQAPTEWLSSFYSSVGKIQQAYAEDDFEFGGNQINLQSSYMQAAELQRSLTQAFGLYALELVYNGGAGYVDAHGSLVKSSFTNPNATIYTQATILVPGVIPPAVVVVFLTLWALGSVLLSLLYGFRL